MFRIPGFSFVGDGFQSSRQRSVMDAKGGRLEKPPLRLVSNTIRQKNFKIIPCPFTRSHGLRRGIPKGAPLLEAPLRPLSLGTFLGGPKKVPRRRPLDASCRGGSCSALTKSAVINETFSVWDGFQSSRQRSIMDAEGGRPEKPLLQFWR